MAVKKDVINCTTTGQSVDWFLLGMGDHYLYFKWSGSPGAASPKVRKPGTTTWFPIENASSGVAYSATANRAIVIPGGQEVSVDLVTATSNLEMTFSRAGIYRQVLDGK